MNRSGKIRLAGATLLTALGLAVAPAHAQIPVYKIVPVSSSIKFNVKASVALVGSFDKWDATLTFPSPDVESGVLDVQIQAASVNTGSGMKDGKLKGKDFFNVAQNPTITFHSTKIVQTGPTTFEVDGDFTIRGVTKPEKLVLTLTGKGTGSGVIQGSMAFDRKDYGMNSNIPFIKIADHVEVDVDLKATRTSGPPLVYKQ
jgi:polyisoprenoid-binding protein YceI